MGLSLGVGLALLVVFCFVGGLAGSIVVIEKPSRIRIRALPLLS